MRWLFVASASVLLSTRLLAQTADVPVPPEPEQYLSDGRYSAYAQAAQEFVRDHPDAPAAPRVAMDLLVTASVYDDQASANRMRVALASNYPTSAQGKYLVGSMSQVSEFVQLMSLVAEENFESQPPGFAVRFDQAMRLGVARFGAAALGEGMQLVRVALIAGGVNDTQMAQAAIYALNQSGAGGEIWRRIVVMVADNSATVMKRVTELHALADRGAAIPFEFFLLNHLSSDQRQATDAETIEADDLLEMGRMGDALPILEKLCDAPNAEIRLQFWRAWATAANGDYIAADRLLRSLHDAHTDDPWGKEAGELAPAAATLDATMAANVEAALAVSRHMKAGIDALEAHATYLRSDGQKITVYFGFNGPKLYELLLQRGTDTVMAYRAGDQEASLLLPGETRIAHYTKDVMYPAPDLTLGRMGNDYGIRQGLKFVYSFDEMKSVLSNITASDTVATREGLGDLLQSMTRKGVFPLPTLTAGGGTVYTWVSPDVTTPTVGRAAFTVSADGTVIALRAGGFDLTDLHYGPAGTVTVMPPPLPPLPADEKGPMNAAVIQVALPAVYEVFSPPPPSTQPVIGK